VGGVSRGRPVARKREALLHGRYFETATGATLIVPTRSSPESLDTPSWEHEEFNHLTHWGLKGLVTYYILTGGMRTGGKINKTVVDHNRCNLMGPWAPPRCASEISGTPSRKSEQLWHLTPWGLKGSVQYYTLIGGMSREV
jgi:hypothetical protein